MLGYQLPSVPLTERQAARQEFCEAAAQARAVALRLARAALWLERTGAHYYAGASSIPHFAECNGMAAHEARTVLWLGRALEVHPEIETDVAQGTIPVASGAILGEVFLERGLVRPEDDWIGWAKAKSTKDLRQTFLRRRDEAREHKDVTPVTAYVTLQAKEDMARARVLASRNAHMPLTLGHTMGIVFGEWLDHHDTLRKEDGTRRMADTATRPDDRRVAAAEDRAVRRRTFDRCIVPLCGHEIWVHRSHRVPHALGGGREAKDLDLLCDYHHLLYEMGVIRITGTADEPTITTSDGRLLSERQPLIYPFPEPGQPPWPGAAGEQWAIEADRKAAEERAARPPEASSRGRPPPRPWVAPFDGSVGGVAVAPASLDPPPDSG